MAVFQVCDNEDDFQQAYVLFQLNWTQHGYEAPPEQALRQRYESNELLIAKEGDEVAAIFQFHLDESESGLGHYIVFYVKESFKLTGVTVGLLNYASNTMQSRGVTHLEIWSFASDQGGRILQENRNFTFDRQELYNGILYNVYTKIY